MGDVRADFEQATLAARLAAALAERDEARALLECWEPGHAYRNAPPDDATEHRQRRTYCAACVDVAVEIITRPLAAKLAAAEGYDVTCEDCGHGVTACDGEYSLDRWRENIRHVGAERDELAAKLRQLAEAPLDSWGRSTFRRLDADLATARARITALEQWGRQAWKFIDGRKAILGDGYGLSEAGAVLGLGEKGE